MDIFAYRDTLIGDYAAYVKSFIQIRDQKISAHVEESLESGILWPEPLIQLNPSFETGGLIDDLVEKGLLHKECSRVFRLKSDRADHGRPLRLHRHQKEAVEIARGGHNYVLTTGTASGKSMAYIVPIVDNVLRRGSRRGIQAIVIYPMNALANSQALELEKFLGHGYPDGKGPVTFARYTGQESDEERKAIIANPPDILLTNYVMLELILTRPDERGLVESAQDLRFLVLDELHTYRGRQGADVAFLVRRVKDRLSANNLQYVGTSATIAGSGTYDERRGEVARVASQIFGAPVKPEHIIGETLRRATPVRDIKDTSFVEELRARITDPERRPAKDFDGFVADPLSVWLETTFGVTNEEGSGRLIRTKPRSISGQEGAASDLSQLTGVPVERCEAAIREGLLAGYDCEKNSDTGFPPFAFRLHQFISRGDTVYASIETQEERYITVNGQQYVPGDRERVLIPLVFCRECGQEYYCIRATHDTKTQLPLYLPRQLNDLQRDDESEPGFLYVSTTFPWPSLESEVVSRVPVDWLEDTAAGAPRIRSDRRKYLPKPITVGTKGYESEHGIDAHYVGALFRFCLNCGVSYAPRQTDFAKLASLGSEGRSTATTITSISAVRGMRRADDLQPEARKLLSFTDNRQDASLQSGHFNDFIEVGLLRSAVYRAVEKMGTKGMAHDELAQKIFDALDLPLEYYASNPEVRFQGLRDTQASFREVLGYRVYRDLRRGWRITSPNLEQCGLLDITYPSLTEVCEAEDVWQNLHPALNAATPDVRARICEALLDYLRRELAIKVNYLDPLHQERLKQQSSQKLIEPWAIDENETTEFARTAFPRPRGQQDTREAIFVSGRGGFGQFLRRPNTFEHLNRKLTMDETEEVIRQIFDVLREGGLVEAVVEPEPARNGGRNKKAKEGSGNTRPMVPGYQLLASAMHWTVGDGTQAFHDPIRRPNEPDQGSRTNAFFVDFYRNAAKELQGFEAREHTAQVDYDERLKREQRFREGHLPVLYCSPTMELGVDIAQLNVVNMRNVPPTPANYAQRSGRAGRSGQPALVFTYCSTYSPHDQYFFRRPQNMVAGAVAPPRLDLANEDLVRAHVHAIWLAETGLSLGKSLKKILDLSGDPPSLELVESAKADVENTNARVRAKHRAENVLSTISEELAVSDWYSDRWLDDTLTQVALRFDQTCDRWRGLYLSAFNQAEVQGRVIRDASRSLEDKRQAERLRREAEAQLKLLAEVENLSQSDFYSYRYFASEGFLPGYSFPRLPISAFIPGRRAKQRDEFLTRGRFLAVSEFGPQAIVYHEGSKYVINKVILPPLGDDDLLTQRAKLCDSCGYLHPIASADGPDLCQHCGVGLGTPLTQLFKMQNVSTMRRDKINSDEEERTRMGYEIITGVRFAEHGGQPSSRTASVRNGTGDIAKIDYGQAATIWRINRGWNRRKKDGQLGFVLDVERGNWLSKKNDEGVEDPEDIPKGAKTARVLPFVEDTRNCLLFTPSTVHELPVMLSLMSALKRALEAQYQLEDNELAAELLPSGDNPRQILFFESSEGGAGVLRRLLDNSHAISQVAKRALEICHFDETGEDKRRAPNAREDCEASCYDCLLNYFNQRFHRQLDRHSILDVLMDLTVAEVNSSPVAASRNDHLEHLLRLAGSELERDWLRFLETNQYRLPSKAQCLIERCETRPDFVYDQFQTVIYIDGPHHEYPERQSRDRAQEESLLDFGYTVIRFDYKENWEEVIVKYPGIFGKK